MAIIKSIRMNEFAGAFSETINFQNGLNILSGENGTAKTTILKRIKEYCNNNSGDIVIESNDPQVKSPNQLQIFAMSPKRNAEKSGLDQVFARLRRENKTFDTFFNETRNKVIVDTTFDSYSSFGELFIYYYDLSMKGGDKTPKSVTEAITTEFNSVLKQVFPTYEIAAQWEATSDKPVLKLKVNDVGFIDLQQISCGQSEVMSLMFNLYVSRDKYHVYLIDEPEIHLNWNLERGVFEFLDWFCTTYSKQVILTTHSRIIFKDKFIPKCIFLTWNKKVLEVKSSISEREREAIVGDIATNVLVAAPDPRSFFVEDIAHKNAIDALASHFGKPATVVVCGDSDNVKSLFRLTLAKSSSWADRGYFIVDGDNQGPIKEFSGETRFIKLSRYSIESYLFNTATMTKALSINENDLRAFLLDTIKNHRQKIFSKGGKASKLAQELVLKLKPEDLNDGFFAILDCSDMLPFVLDKYHLSAELLWSKFVGQAATDHVLEKVFDKELLAAIQS